jgi:hypothetical protein
LYEFPDDSGTDMEILSESAEDGPAGIGARKIRITGLAANTKLLRTQEVVLNGQTAVNVGTGFSRINFIEAIEFGSENETQGKITLRKVGDTADYAYICPIQTVAPILSHNKNLSSVLSVPAKAKLEVLSVLVGKGTDIEVEMIFRYRNDSTGWAWVSKDVILQDGIPSNMPFAQPMVFDGKTDVQVIARRAKGHLGTGSDCESKMSYILTQLSSKSLN